MDGRLGHQSTCTSCSAIAAVVCRLKEEKSKKELDVEEGMSDHDAVIIVA